MIFELEALGGANSLILLDSIADGYAIDFPAVTEIRSIATLSLYG